MRHIKIRPKFVLGTSLVALLSILTFASPNTPYASASGGSVDVTGTVKRQSGTPVANVSVYATDPGGSTADYGPVTTASDGSYDLPLGLVGTYDFHYVPSSGSGLNPVTDSNVTVMGDQTINVILTPLTHVFSGTLLNGDSNPIPNLTFMVGSQNVTSDSNGNFSATLPAAAYTVGISTSVFNTQTRATTYGAQAITVGDTVNTVDLSSGDVNENITLATVPVTVTVLDANGNPVSGAAVTAYARGGNFSWFANGQQTVRIQDYDAKSTTDSSGVAVVGSLVNAQYNQGAGTTEIQFNICASISGYGNICLPNVNPNNPYVVTQPTSLTFQELPTHTFSGTLRNGTGNPIPNLTFIVGSQNITTDTNGHFSASVPEGIYPLSINTNVFNSQTSAATNGAQFINVGDSPSAQSVDLTNSDVNEDITLPTQAVTVTVLDGNGNPVQGATVTAYARGGHFPWFTGGPQTSLIGDYDAKSTTNSSGVAVVGSLLNAQYSQSAGPTGIQFNICATIPNYGNICLPNINPNNPYVVTQPTSLTFQEIVTHTFSGSLLNGAGNPIPNLTFMVGSQNITTDANGHFSASVPAGAYPLSINTNINGQATATVAATYGAQFINVGDTSNTVDLSSGDVSENITLATVPVTVTVLDSSGNPIHGATVTAYARGGSFSWFATGQPTSRIGDYDAQAITNNSGIAVVGSLMNANYTQSAGSTGIQYNICATVSGYGTMCIPPLNGSTYVITQPTSLVFQEVAPVPSAPSNLQAASPTQNPSLTWTSASGATSYNVYRNGTKVASASSNHYVDNTAPEGNVTYYVTAQNTSGESAQSNSITVIVDQINPNISYTLNPTANSNGWNNTSVTVTFNCSDSGSGISTCTPPVTLINDGANQTVTGTAFDQAGNSASVTAIISIDETAPTITYTVSPATNSNGWNNSNVTVTFHCSDTISDIASCSAPLILTNDGINQTVTGNATDMAGNTTSVTTTAIKIDKTLPTISYSLSPAPNTNGWNNSNVTVTFTCGDALSGIDTCSAPVTVSTESSTQTVTGTAADKADNQAAVTTSAIKIDKTAPSLGTATVSPNPIVDGQSTTLTVPVSDSLSGVAGGEYFVGTTDPGQGHGTAMTLGSGSLTASISSLSPGKHTISYRAQDVAGNWTSVQTIQVTVKSHAPTVAATTPTNHPPVLNWVAVNGVASYDVYRGNTKIGSTSSLTYTDSGATANTAISYYVIAVTSDSVASDQSNTVSVVYDTIAPNISTPTLSAPTVLLGGLQSETLTASTTDNLSGVASAEYYITTSNTAPTATPGTGTAMTYSNGTVSATFTANGGLLSTNYVWVRVKDTAGNWSGFVHTSYIVIVGLG